MQPGNIVVRHDQPDQQGIIVDVISDVIIFVAWHERTPSYEHIHDLRLIKKAAADAAPASTLPKGSGRIAS